MNSTFPCSESPCKAAVSCGRMVCHCLGITEATIVDTIVTLGLRNVKEVRSHTGAGDGCTACHQALKQLLEIHSSSSPEYICSAR
jgi:NifU-like protein